MTARGDPPPADLTPSGQRGSRLRRCTPCPLAALRSWRLPGLLFLHGTLDDHDRLGTRRPSSAGKCSSRRAAHHAPRTEGWRRATPQTTPTARRSAPPPAPSGGGQSVAIGPGRRDRQVSLRPVHGDLCSPPLWSKRGGSRCAARPRRAGRGHPGYQTPKSRAQSFQNYFLRNSFRSFSLTR